jgi:hypothetical protein
MSEAHLGLRVPHQNDITLESMSGNLQYILTCNSMSTCVAKLEMYKDSSQLQWKHIKGQSSTDIHAYKPRMNLRQAKKPFSQGDHY